MPPSSTQAIEPPPAPTDTISSTGVRIGNPSISLSERQRRAAVLNQADIGRGAAHVEGDQVLEARARGLARGADHAGGGPKERGDGVLRIAEAEVGRRCSASR